MFKKFMSYLLTFALLHSNAAWAGNGRVFGMLDLEEDDAHSSPIAIPRKSQDEKTPLKTTGRKPIPNPLIQFQSLKDLSTVGSQAGNIQGHSLGFPLEDQSMDSSGSKPMPDLSTKTNDGDIPDLTGINFQEIAAKANLPQPLQTPLNIEKNTNSSFAPAADKEKDSSEDSPRRPSSESSPPLTSSSPEGEHHHDSSIPLQRTTLDLSSSGEGSGGNAPSLAIPNPADEDSDSGDPDMDFSKLKVTDKDKNEGPDVKQPLLEPKDQAADHGVQKITRIEVSGDGAPKPCQQIIEVSGTGPADGPLQLKQSINSHHALISLGDGDDPEDGWGKFTSPIVTDSSLQAVFKALLHLHYLIEGKPTTRQMLIGGIGGALIGIGVGNAMPPIFMGSLDDLGSDFIDTMTNNDLVAQLFISHTAISLGIDAIARNVRILGELAGPSTEEFSVPKTKTMKNMRRGLLAFIYGGAGTAALLPVYLLWDSQAEHLKNHPEDRDGTLTFFGCLSVPLFLDACLLVSHAAKSWMDKKINDHCVRQAYTHHPSLKIRKKELTHFKELAYLFAAMDDGQIRTPYEAIYAQGLHRTTKYASLLSEEQLKILDVLHTLKALQKLYPNEGHDAEFMIQEAENWRTTTSTLLSHGIPLAASVGRSMVFWYVVDDLLSSLGLPSGPSKDFLSIVGGELVAALFQGVLELNTSKKALSDMLYTGDEEETSHNPWWKTCRIIGKGYTYLQGAWNTLPYMLVGAKVTGFWPSWTRIVTLLPFGIADTFNNSMNFQEAYGDVIGATESVAAHYGKVTPGYMRKTLISLANKCHELYDILDPQVMSGLHTTFLKYEKLLETLTKLDQPSHLSSHSLLNKEPTGEKK